MSGMAGEYLFCLAGTLRNHVLGSANWGPLAHESRVFLSVWTVVYR